MRKCPNLKILLLNTHDSQQLRMIDLTIETDFCLQFSFQNSKKLPLIFCCLTSNRVLRKFAACRELTESGHQLAPPVGEIASLRAVVVDVLFSSTGNI